MYSHQYDYPSSVININFQSGPQKKSKVLHCLPMISYYYLFTYLSIYAIPSLSFVSDYETNFIFFAFINQIKTLLLKKKRCPVHLT